MFWLPIILTIITIIFGLKLYIYGNDDYWPKRKIPLIPGSSRGSLWDRLLFRIPMHELDHRVYKELKPFGNQLKYGGIMEFRRPIAFIMDLELIKNIMVKDFDHFINRRPFGIRKDDPTNFGRTLFMLEGQEWKNTRAAMSPTFTTGKIRKMFQIFNESSMKLIKYLEEEISSSSSGEVEGGEPGELNLRDSCSRFTSDVIASTAFGIDSQNFKEKNSLFSVMGKRIATQFKGLGAIKLMMAMLLPGLFSALRLNLLDMKATQFFTDVTRKTIAHRRKTGERRDDFLQLLLDARAGQLMADDDDEDGVQQQVQPTAKVSAVEWTDEMIVAQGLLFFLAGVDATETTLGYTLYELALNPEIQERLVQEIQQSQGDEGQQQLTYDLLNQNAYLDMVISETLRKYPPGIRAERKCTTEYQIPGTPMIIPQGQICLIPIYSIHHDPDYYPEPDKYIPERFSTENKKSRHPYAYMPFGAGPRNCIAMRFAIMQAKTVIANLVMHFKFEPCNKTSIPMVFESTAALKPKYGMWLKLTPRSEN